MVIVVGNLVEYLFLDKTNILFGDYFKIRDNSLSIFIFNCKIFLKIRYYVKDLIFIFNIYNIK